MADRLNDTDPQSPRARVSRTDPGIGDAPAIVVPRTDATPLPPETSPSPGSASIEDLIDGITGPRPPSSRPSRRTTPRPVAVMSDAARAYLAARAAAAASPTAPAWPEEDLTPEPALYSGARERPVREVAPRIAPESAAATTVRKPAEERTVHTGRRALVRKTLAAVASAAAVALMMTSILRWKEANRPHRPPEVVVPSGPSGAVGAQLPSTVVAPPPAAVVPVPVATSPVQTVPIDALPAAAPPPSAPDVAPLAPLAAPKQSPSTSRRAKTKSPPPDSLDDLNRQIPALTAGAGDRSAPGAAAGAGEGAANESQRTAHAWTSSDDEYATTAPQSGFLAVVSEIVGAAVRDGGAVIGEDDRRDLRRRRTPLRRRTTS